MKSDLSRTQDSRIRDTKIIPLYFVIAFLVVFAVNGLFVYLATSTNSGLVVEDPYERGLEFDRIVSEVRKQKQQQTGQTPKP